MSDGFLFSDDRERAERQAEWERKSRIFGTPEFWQRYNKYTRSARWTDKCRLVRKRARNLCEKCGEPFIERRGFGVHHLTYDHFESELLSELLFLCYPCHRAGDRERKACNRRAFEEAGEEAREAAWKNSYFTTKYGEDWWMRYGDDPQGMNDEFDDWRRRKEEEDGY